MAADMNSQREKKKEILRNQVLEGKGRAIEVPSLVQKNRKYILAAAVMVAALLTLILICVVIYRNFRTYSTYQVKWTVDVNNPSSEKMIRFGNGIALMGKDGVIFYDQKGNSLWTAPYDMENPVSASEGNYLLIYDRQGQSMIVCDQSGKTGNISTSYPVSRADISAGGVVAAVLEDTKASYISYFRSTGEKLEVEIQSPMATSGYPRDISISPNGQQLMVSYYSIGGAEGSCRVDFYDFDQGKSQPDRIVGSFSYQETDTYIPLVVYSSNTSAFSVGTNLAAFYSARDRSSITQVTIPVEGEIQKAFYSEEYLGLVIQEEEGILLRVYNMSGRELAEIPQESVYENYGFNGKQVVMYNDSHCRMISFNGRERLSLKFANGIGTLAPVGDGESFYLTTMDVMQKIILK